MKKLLLILLIFPCLLTQANELTEDYLDIAVNYCTYGKYETALTYIDKILQIEPSNIEAKELKNTLLRTLNPNIESYLSATNNNIKQAFGYKKIGNTKGEISALTASPNDFWSNYLLAESYRNSHDNSNAIYYYNKAISLNPNYSQSYLGLGKAYLDNKEFQNAIDNFNKYINYNKNSDIAYALRADANLNLNKLAEAQHDINTALNIEENISYLLIQAKILYYKGDYDNAREKLNLLTRNIQTAEVYKYLGLCDYAQNDYPNAMLNLDKAIILSDEDKSLISTYNNIKMILDKQ